MVYKTVKRAYRFIATDKLNVFLFGGRNSISRAILKFKKKLEENADHDVLYDSVYFERQIKNMAVSAKGIADSLVEKVPAARTVVDVGCGSGSVLFELKQRGLAVVGLEYAEAALTMCKDRGLDVRKFDIESDAPVDLKSDVVVSTEVAEHLPENCADRFVDLLTGISDIVVMTAATPGQGGTDHVNEQPNSYWIEKFLQRGFMHEPDVTTAWRADWRERQVDRHRANNVMFFKRASK